LSGDVGVSTFIEGVTGTKGEEEAGSSGETSLKKTGVLFGVFLLWVVDSEW
jgi:hypothetical protein